MLQLKNIIKNYYVGDTTVEALKGVNISFRKSEFVSILGPSGCGKTTLLNIVGGLDRYTSGDIVINGISTTLYNDSDWDSYRNHSIGFIFQSYNLIPHQTVLENVELALTLSGIKPKERRERALEALEKVGLKDHIKKLPSQMSGGQMQRVAIARAIVNNPEIILADEPTGALDTETSIQVMDILKELSKDKLIIMVTHNPELAERYSSRIIKLKDGTVREDSNPFEYTFSDKVNESEIDDNELTDENKNQDTPHKKKKDKKKDKGEKKPSMSFGTALNLSLKNLKTKLARTILTSFAGSIGIIGIALILSLSAGFSGYIEKIQRDTLSNYPITLGSNTFDPTSFTASYMDMTDTSGLTEYPKDGNIVPNKMIESMLDSATKTMGINDLTPFKEYLESHPELIDPEKISAVSYDYNFGKNIYQSDGNGGYHCVNKIAPLEEYMPDGDNANDKIFRYATEMIKFSYPSFKMMMEEGGTWGELLNNNALIKSQYELLEGDWPSQEVPKNGEAWPIVVVVDKYNRIPDYALHMMGLLDNLDVKYIFSSLIYHKMEERFPDKYNADEILKGQFGDLKPYEHHIKFKDLIGKEYRVVLNGEYFRELKNNDEIDKEYYTYPTKDGKPYELNDFEKDNKFVDDVIRNAPKIKVCGVLRLKKSGTAGALSKSIYYTPAFTKYLMDKTASIPVVKKQLQYDEEAKVQPFYIDATTGKKIFKGKGNEKESENLALNRKLIGMVDPEKPASISIYPTSFENKDYVLEIIDHYNKNEGEDKPLNYTDYVGMMMSSITVIIDAITYVLIAFVSISLVVSSIMIGVITYISVLERTKEIGILRSIGASKRDISRVFNAETIIIGFVAGMLGIIITILLNIPISLIINMLAGIPGVAKLPVLGGVILVTISVLLTLIAGLIPSKMASKKDPVIALRSE